MMREKNGGLGNVRLKRIGVLYGLKEYKSGAVKGCFFWAFARCSCRCCSMCVLRGLRFTSFVLVG